MSSDDKSTHKDWRELAEQASKETDPEKLATLVQELCSALDHRTPSLERDREREREKPVNKKGDAVD